VSKSDFEAVSTGFGISTQQADQDFAAMDSNGDGSISHSEMLFAMSATSQGSSSLSGGLRQMMDTNHDGSMSGTEYVNLETSLVGVEK
jgi:Ca2+-binding EF-hand superfamily protein